MAIHSRNQGGTFEHGIRPQYIFITSNYSINECFPDPNDSEPMKRRCYEFFKEDKESWIPIYKDDDVTQTLPIMPISGYAETQVEPLLTPELEVLESG